MTDEQIETRSTYYLGIRTGIMPDPTTYQEQAEGLIEHLRSILGDLATVQTLTRMSPFNDFKTNIEIRMEDGELCAAAVVDIDSPGKVQLDKTRFSKLIKDKYGKSAKIEQRAVDGLA